MKVPNLVGRTISEVDVSHDGCSSSDIYMKFTDGSAIVFSYTHKPVFEAKLFKDENDDNGKKLKLK